MIDEIVNILKNAKQPKSDFVVLMDNFKNPYLVLIACILSLRTNDKTTYPATLRMLELAKTPKDMKQAINVVNMLGEDFKSFLYLKPTYKDLYERVFEFFKEHLGKGFTATQLKRKYYKDFGCSRKTFNKEFEEIIQYVKEIAIENGYIFSTTNLQPSGAKYSLIVAPSGELSEGVLPLDELIKDG